MKKDIQITPETTFQFLKSYKEFDFLNENDKKPTKLQEYLIPLILKEKNLLIESPKETGKTYGYLISLLYLSSKKKYKTLIIAKNENSKTYINNSITKIKKNQYSQNSIFSSVNITVITQNEIEKYFSKGSFLSLDYLVFDKINFSYLKENVKEKIKGKKVLVINDSYKSTSYIEKMVENVVKIKQYKKIRNIVLNTDLINEFKLNKKIYESLKSIKTENNKKKLKKEEILYEILKNMDLMMKWPFSTKSSKVVIFIKDENKKKEILHELKKQNYNAGIYDEKTLTFCKKGLVNVLLAGKEEIEMFLSDYLINYDIDDINIFKGQMNYLKQNGLRITLINRQSSKALVKWLKEKTHPNEIPLSLKEKTIKTEKKEKKEEEFQFSEKEDSETEAIGEW